MFKQLYRILERENIFIPGKRFITKPIQFNMHFSTSYV